MAKVITQDTFDDVVKENVVEFSMSPNEAKEETIKQFEAQGINLANIIKDLDLNAETGKPVLNETINSLKSYVAGNLTTDQDNLLKMLKILDIECQKSIPHRVLASKNGAQTLLLTMLEQQINNNVGENLNSEIVEATLKAVNSLSNKLPDIFDSSCLSLAVRLLNVHFKDSVICLTLQWLQKACVMHEMNRQNIIKANIVQYLKPFVTKGNSKILRDVLAVFRYLTLDDDIRVEFGCAHEHARLIANEVITDLTQLLGEYDDVNVLADLLLTIGVLAVRQEFCFTVHEAGGLKLIFQAMTSNLNVPRLNREAFKLLRALAGHDLVKVHILQEGAAPIFKDILETHMSNESVVSAALACISTLTLRVKENSISFFETGITETVVEAMRSHPQSKLVQRNGAWAIRNMVSRSRDQCEVWLSYGVEELLNAAMIEHPSVQQDIKAALRDLECKVELKEEWTGTAEKKILNKA